jgi:putative transposase
VHRQGCPHELVFRRRAAHPNQTSQSDLTELDILIVGADGKLTGRG